MLNQLGTYLYTKLFGQFVGTDSFCNTYYQNTSGKRWVIYNGVLDASKIPAEWHGWLHGTFDSALIPSSEIPFKKPHLPNTTGSLSRQTDVVSIQDIEKQRLNRLHVWSPR